MSENRRWSKVHPNDPRENSELVDCFHLSHWQKKTSPGLEESLPTKRHQCFAKMNKGTIIMISQVMYRNQVKYVSDSSNLTYFDMFLPRNQQIRGEKWSMDINRGIFHCQAKISRRNQLERGVKTYQNLHDHIWWDYHPQIPAIGFWPKELHLQQDVRDAVSRARVKTLKETETGFSLQVFVAVFVADEAKKMGGFHHLVMGIPRILWGMDSSDFTNKVMENKQNWCHRKKAGDLTIIEWKQWGICPNRVMGVYTANMEIEWDFFATHRGSGPRRSEQ